jgi:hypothetical protein
MRMHRNLNDPHLMEIGKHRFQEHFAASFIIRISGNSRLVSSAL